jgi:hypothetical protein
MNWLSNWWLSKNSRLTNALVPRTAIVAITTGTTADVVGENHRSVFICYAHEDNSSSDPERRRLDRLLQFIHPIVRQGDLKTWSDKDIKIGEKWQERIRHQLELSRAAILIVSPLCEA